MIPETHGQEIGASGNGVIVALAIIDDRVPWEGPFIRPYMTGIVSVQTSPTATGCLHITFHFEALPAPESDPVNA